MEHNYYTMDNLIFLKKSEPELYGRIKEHAKKVYDLCRQSSIGCDYKYLLTCLDLTDMTTELLHVVVQTFRRRTGRQFFKHIEHYNCREIRATIAIALHDDIDQLDQQNLP